MNHFYDGDTQKNVYQANVTLNETIKKNDTIKR